MTKIKTIEGLVRRFIIEKKYSNHNRDDRIWLFGEWFGKRANDNCLYFANYICENHPEITVFWASNGIEDCSLMNKKIHIVHFGTNEIFQIYKSAGVVIMNQGYVDFSSEGFNYFKGAKTINLWHGVPWKRIGYDISRKNGFIHNAYLRVLDYFNGTDFFLSTSEEFSEILKTALHLNDDHLICAGYPRNMTFYSSEQIEDNRNKIIELIQKNKDVNIDQNTNIVVYMPTFRDNEGITEDPLNNLYENPYFTNWLYESNTVIIRKDHYINLQRNETFNNTESKRILSINDVNPVALLCSADILITDYSSCFFDFLLLNRPIIHYIYDYEKYKTIDRGLYYSKEEVACGKCVFSGVELEKAIKDYVNDCNMDSQLRIKRKHKYMQYESSNSNEKIFKAINN